MNIKKLTYSLSRVGLSLLTMCLIGCGNSNDSPKTKVLLESKDAGDVGISSDVSLPVFKKGEPAARFELTDQEGNQFDSATLKGKVWMGSVFFANCPGPCFRENQAIADIVREIDDPNFIAVSLTCDPENDTPAALAHYADRFEADPQRWKFLTGDMDVIKRVGTKTFLLPVEIGVHSERGAVFDREGRLRGSYHLLQEDRVERLKKLIRDVLAEEDATARVEETD
ncbi:MAG: SCO family protein [Planctomycetaceae bacterium]|nr:SCO family protein [Planctomycetaceae bacterium]MBT6055844.1 SCO family protein [Planctomycetaceae bacterium]